MKFLASVSLALAALAPFSELLMPSVGALPTHIKLEPRAQIRPRMGYSKKVRGVNLGGHFILEAWMSPALFTPDLVAKGAIDQWTYMTAWGSDTAGALAALQQHWATWIVEDDLRQIAAAGLNTVRLPIPHWLWSSPGSETEPYIVGAELPYIDQVIRWSAKYGLDVMLDMHTAPGSQNGFDNSGRQGPVMFATSSPANTTQNVDRVIFALQESVKRWVNDPSFGNAIKAVEILNEPMMYHQNLTKSFMMDVYRKGFAAIRGAVSPSAGVMPTTIVHDGFLGPLSSWDANFADTNQWPTGSYSQDKHSYQVFGKQWESYTFDRHIQYACGLRNEMASTQTKRPIIMGEWSLGIVCTGCSYKDMASNINSMNNATQNLFYRRFFEAQVSSYEAGGGWIFWNWKTFSRADWSYKDAMAQGWIPKIATDRVFRVDANGCPTNQLAKPVVFATESIPPPPVVVDPVSNSTTTTTSSSSSTSASTTSTTSTSTTSTSTTSTRPTTTTTSTSARPTTTAPVATPTSAVLAPNGYRLSWTLPKRSTYDVNLGFISRFTVGATWIGGSQAVTCTARCDRTRGCAMAELIRFRGGLEGEAVCALYRSYQATTTATYSTGPNSGPGTVVATYGLRRIAGAVARRAAEQVAEVQRVAEAQRADLSIPIIPATGKRINTKVFPVVLKTTFGMGNAPSH